MSYNDRNRKTLIGEMFDQKVVFKGINTNTQTPNTVSHKLKFLNQYRKQSGNQKKSEMISMYKQRGN